MTYRGTTLVETLVAVALMALIVLAVAGGLRAAANSEKRVRAVTEVEAQAGAAMYDIAQSIRNATSITSPATSTTAASLTLATGVAGQNPTVFATSSTLLTMAQGGGAAVPLTSQNVSVTALSFQNVSTTTAKAVRVSMTLSFRNTTGQAAFDYAKTYQTTVTLR